MAVALGSMRPLEGALPMDWASAGTALNGGAYTQPKLLLGEEIVRIIGKYRERT